MRVLTIEEAVYIVLFNLAYAVPFLMINWALGRLGLPDSRLVLMTELVLCMLSALAAKLAIERYFPRYAFWKRSD